MDDELNRTDLNTAERIELKNVPGIGSKLADRIIAARPFTNLVDIRRVGGVGPVLFEQLKPYVAISPISASTLQTETALPVSEVPVVNVSNPEQPPIMPPPVSAALTAVETPSTVSKGITRAEMWAIAAASSVLSFILAVFFTLIILGSINGGLRFVRPLDLDRLASQVNTIDTQATSLRGDIDSLQTHISTVEGLDGRVNSVEQNAQQLRKDMDSVSGSVDTLGKRIDDLAFQTDALVTRTGRFQSFLDGLRNLLGNLNQLNAP